MLVEFRSTKRMGFYLSLEVLLPSIGIRLMSFTSESDLYMYMYFTEYLYSLDLVWLVHKVARGFS